MPASDVKDVTVFQCIVEIVRCLTPEQRLLALIEAGLAIRSLDPAERTASVLTRAAATVVGVEIPQQAQ